MKKTIGIITLGLFTMLFSPIMTAAEVKYGYVNVTDIFNKSTFVQQANKSLQSNVKSMEEKLQTQKDALQGLVNNYEKTTGSKKEALAKKIKLEQANLTTMTLDFQKKIKAEQDAGVQKFNILAEAAIAKIAKEKNINAVVNSSALLYVDTTWVDLTKEVETAIQHN
ncbi:MAG: OmpH family outer membrane protein [Legionellales bacterium]